MSRGIALSGKTRPKLVAKRLDICKQLCDTSDVAKRKETG